MNNLQILNVIFCFCYSYLGVETALANSGQCAGRYALLSNNHGGVLYIDETGDGTNIRGRIWVGHEPYSDIDGFCRNGRIYFQRSLKGGQLQFYEGSIIQRGYGVELQGSFTQANHSYSWTAYESPRQQAHQDLFDACSGRYPIWAGGGYGMMDVHVDSRQVVTGHLWVGARRASILGTCNVLGSGRIQFSLRFDGVPGGTFVGKLSVTGALGYFKMLGTVYENDRQYPWSSITP